MSQLAPTPVPGVRFLSNGPHLNPECTSIRPGRMIFSGCLSSARSEPYVKKNTRCTCHQNYTHSSPRMWATRTTCGRLLGPCSVSSTIRTARRGCGPTMIPPWRRACTPTTRHAHINFGPIAHHTQLASSASLLELLPSAPRGLTLSALLRTLRVYTNKCW